jgi:hypothetical protein
MTTDGSSAELPSRFLPLSRKARVLSDSPEDRRPTIKHHQCIELHNSQWGTFSSNSDYAPILFRPRILSLELFGGFPRRLRVHGIPSRRQFRAGVPAGKSQKCITFRCSFKPKR